MGEAWKWLLVPENGATVLVIVAVVGVVWKMVTHLSRRDRIPNGGVSFDANEVVNHLVESHKRERASYEQQLSGYEQRSQQQNR